MQNVQVEAMRLLEGEQRFHIRHSKRSTIKNQDKIFQRRYAEIYTSQDDYNLNQFKEGENMCTTPYKQSTNGTRQQKRQTPA